MNSRSHQVAQQREYLSVAGNCVFSDERRRNQYQPVMSAAIARAGMAGMQMGVVGKLEMQRFQRGQSFAQGGLDLGGSVHQAGSTFLKGLTVTFSYTPAAI